MKKEKTKLPKGAESISKSPGLNMKKGKLKLALLIYDADYDDEIMEFFSSDIVTGFTKWDKVHGAGKRSDPRMSTSVWPGHNCAIISLLSGEMEDEFRVRIKNFVDEHKGSGIKLFIIPLLEVI